MKKINKELVMYSTVLVLSIVVIAIHSHFYPQADTNQRVFLLLSNATFVGVILMQLVNITCWVRERL
jgi:peptidoglycan biosynthesis protein MviN/MurJ (putative lipid II flippase)